MKKLVYIAGKIKGLDHTTVKNKFLIAESKLLHNNFDIFNPFKFINLLNIERVAAGLPTLKDECVADRYEILRICTQELLKCEYIYLLPCWQNSEGAIFEKTIADKVGIKTINNLEEQKNEDLDMLKKKLQIAKQALESILTWQNDIGTKWEYPETIANNALDKLAKYDGGIIIKLS